MLRQLFAFLAFINLSLAPAYGQAWTVGPVSPVWSGTTPWTDPYPALDDPLPAAAYEPPPAASDNVIYNRADWYVTNMGGRASPGTTANGASPTVGGANEAKFRIQCASSFSKRADPILAPGQHPALHGHTVLGWMDRSNFETVSYTSARTNPKSTCDGGPLNASVYWEPSLYHKIGGVLFAKKPELTINYYVLSPSEGQVARRLHRNYGVIGGANPADYNDTARRAEYAAGNMVYPGSPSTPAGVGGWQCRVGEVQQPVLPEHALPNILGDPSPVKARYLKGPNGEDPWGGSCNNPGYIDMLVEMPQCWDATNLRSPNGRDHARYYAVSSIATLPSVSCPLNYVKILNFSGRTVFIHKGWNVEVKDWFLASDRMNAASTPADPSSHDPCRRVGPYFCNGATIHFDIIFAFDDDVLKRLQRDCIGMRIDGVDGTHADCGVGGFGDNMLMKTQTQVSPSTLWSGPRIGQAPGQQASGTARGRRYFPIDPDDQVQDGTAFDLHQGHGGGMAANDNWQSFKLEDAAA